MNDQHDPLRRQSDLHASLDLAHATAATYLLAKADMGKRLKVKVTGRLDGWTTASKTSKRTGKVSRKL